MRWTDVVARLRDAGCVFAEDEARLILEAGGDVEALVRRRESGEPLEYLLGWAEFCDLRIAVEPGVFVPRRRSSLLVDEAVDLVHGGDIVVDLCCGTGALGAALAARVPGLEVYGTDLDPAAVHCARRNIAQVYEGDLFGAVPHELRGRIAVLLVNAPYVPSDAIALMPPEARDHEARVALDGGPDGLQLHRRIAAEAHGWLRPGGHLLIETSDLQQPTTEALLRSAGFETRTARSDELDATAVVARVRSV